MQKNIFSISGNDQNSNIKKLSIMSYVEIEIFVHSNKVAKVCKVILHVRGMWKGVKDQHILQSQQIHSNIFSCMTLVHVAEIELISRTFLCLCIK